MKRYWVYDDEFDRRIAGPFDSENAANLCRVALEQETGDEYAYK